jgi:hypothetical protein
MKFYTGEGHGEVQRAIEFMTWAKNQVFHFLRQFMLNVLPTWLTFDNLVKQPPHAPPDCLKMGPSRPSPGMSPH